MKTSDLIAAAKKNPIPFGAGVLTVILAAVIYFRSDLVPDTAAELETRSNEEHRYALNIANATQLKEHLESLQAANKVIESRLIHASQIGINQQFFYKLESEYGVKLTEVHQNMRPASTIKPGYQPVGFSVAVQGDFPSVMNFLRGLEGGAHYCRVLSATCSGGRKGPVSLVINLELLGLP
jgi:hypothetical protein